MRLKAGCELRMSTSGPVPLVAMLRPRSGAAQWVMSERYELEPFVKVVEYVDTFGNLCQRLTAPAGNFRILTEVVIEVNDTITVAHGTAPTACEFLPDYALQFLLPSRYCPSDTMEDLAKEVTHAKVPGYDQAEAIRAWIQENIEYRYGVSTASTSATDTLRDKAGVCRDFSHIGMSLCRALHIPCTHGGRLSASAGSYGPSRLVRGIPRWAVVHLRCDSERAQRRAHHHRLRTRRRGRGLGD